MNNLWSNKWSDIYYVCGRKHGKTYLNTKMLKTYYDIMLNQWYEHNTKHIDMDAFNRLLMSDEDE